MCRKFIKAHHRFHQVASQKTRVASSTWQVLKDAALALSHLCALDPKPCYLNTPTTRARKATAYNALREAEDTFALMALGLG